MSVSVIIPFYNVEPQLLEACLDTVVKQTLRPDEYEIILVDDCSTNGDTIAVIGEFTKRAVNMKLVRHTVNLGPNEARWSGIKAASSDYVLFIDGDDMLTRDAIEKLHIRACETAADLVTAPTFRWIRRSKSYSALSSRAMPLPSDYLARLRAVFAEQSFTMWGRLYRREVLTEAVFDLPPRLIHEDLSTFARIVFKSRKVASIGEPVYYYTINEGGLTYRFALDHVDGVFYAFYDWIENAESHGLLKELASAISCGIERFVDSLVIRCVLCETLDATEKVKMLITINGKYMALPLRWHTASRPGTRLLDYLHLHGKGGEARWLQRSLKRSFPRGVPTQPSIETRLEHTLVPTETARRLKGKIIFICQASDHLRDAVMFARALEIRGYRCVVLDNSAFDARGSRQLPARESAIPGDTERIRVARPPYDPDWLSTASMVITFNDFNDEFREALEYRHRLGLPSVCMIAGINDFLRADFQDHRHLPYRRCDYVLLTGNDDQKYFEDRQTYVVGLPVIESLVTRVPAFREKPFGVLNVNFTYGALAEAREGFVSKAKGAFDAAGYDWTITRHPMDKGGLTGYPVSRRTQYDLIDQCSVFVSRFATGILEALASGKPAIYFNPHGEKVEKFKSPMGAYEIATTEEELVQALRNVRRDIEAGVDFRQRALPFLEWHTGYRPGGQPVTGRLAGAVMDILDSHPGQHAAAVSDLFLERLQEQQPFLREEPGLILGEFGQRHRAQLVEEELIARHFGNKGGIMLAAGAASGDGTGIFGGRDWTVHTLEADTNDVVAGVAALRDYYQGAGFRHVDFLKVGGTASSQIIVNGFSGESDSPEVVLVELQEASMARGGCSAHEVADALLRRGYIVCISQWAMVGRSSVRYWRRLIRYCPELELDRGGCNMIGFCQYPGDERLRSLAKETLRFSAPPGAKKVYPGSSQGRSKPGQPHVPVAYRLVEYMIRRHPGLARYAARRLPRLANMYTRLRDKGLLPR